MDGEIARRQEPLDFGSNFILSLRDLSSNRAGFTIEQFIASLKATTSLTDLCVDAKWPWRSTPERNRRVIEPLCRCIANLRRHNPNHPLSILKIIDGKLDMVEQFLVAAKQFGIHTLDFYRPSLLLQSLAEFCRDNSHLKVLAIFGWALNDEDPTISVSSQYGQQDSSVHLTLDSLLVRAVHFENTTVTNKFLNFITHITYPALQLGSIDIAANNKEEKKIERMRIVSALIKPSVEDLTLMYGCPTDVLDVIEACATVTQIQLGEFQIDSVKRRLGKLEAFATRNCELARFVANPRAYPSGDELLALMSQFDNCPTGRYMLARCFPAIPSFYKSASTNSSTAGAKKRKRR